MSQIPKDGGPAFPADLERGPHPGMTLRDWFAGQALVGILLAHREDLQAGCGWNMHATDAYIYADAMLAARVRKGEP